MGFLTSLFGGSGNIIVTTLLALGIVLILIVLGVWALKMLSNATSNVGRGRNKRVMVIDTAVVDQKRQIILIRRDNVEHLILTGTNQDLIIETGIEPPAQQAASQPRTARRAAGPKAPLGRTGPQAAAPAASPDVAAPDMGVERAINGAEERPANVEALQKGRARTSLRYTGLLRQPGRTEPSINSEQPENSSESGADSAKNLPDEPVIVMPRMGVRDDGGADADGHGGHEDRDENQDTKASTSN